MLRYRTSRHFGWRVFATTALQTCVATLGGEVRHAFVMATWACALTRSHLLMSHALCEHCIASRLLPMAAEPGRLGLLHLYGQLEVARARTTQAGLLAVAVVIARRAPFRQCARLATAAATCQGARHW